MIHICSDFIVEGFVIKYRRRKSVSAVLKGAVCGMWPREMISVACTRRALYLVSESSASSFRGSMSKWRPYRVQCFVAMFWSSSLHRLARLSRFDNKTRSLNIETCQDVTCTSVVNFKKLSFWPHWMLEGMSFEYISAQRGTNMINRTIVTSKTSTCVVEMSAEIKGQPL